MRTLVVGPNPVAVAVDADTSRAFVLNQGPQGVPAARGTISVLDTRRLNILRTVTVGIAPDIMAIDRGTQRVFVINQMTFTDGVLSCDGSVSILDARSGRRVTEDITAGIDPVAIAVDEPLRRVLILNRGDTCAAKHGTLSVLAARDGRVLHTIVLGPYPVEVAVDQQRHVAYVGNLSHSTISVIDIALGRVLKTIALGMPEGTLGRIQLDGPRERLLVLSYPPRIENGGSNGAGSLTTLDAGTGRVLNSRPLLNPYSVAIDASSGNALVTIGGLINTARSMEAPGHLIALREPLGKVLYTVRVGVSPIKVVVDARHDRAYVLNEGLVMAGKALTRGSVTILRASSGRELCTDGVGHLPTDLALSQPDARVFVVNTGDNTVSVLRSTCSS